MKRFDVAFGCAGLMVALAVVGCGSKDNATPAAIDPGTTVDGGPTTPGGGLEAAVNDPNTDAGPGMVDGACGGTMMKASARDANLLLVLDKSGSMLQKPDGFAVKKWDAVKVALRDALTPVKGKISLGLAMYPNDTTASGDACAMPSGSAGVTVPVAADSVDKIIEAVNGAMPSGATPTAKALASALDYFTNGSGKDLKGDKYVILATDGGPNCDSSITCGAETCTTNIDGSCDTGGNCCDPSRSKISCLDDKGVIGQIDALKAAGVKTFVIGIPGTEAYKSYLDQFAEHGGMMSSGGDTKYYSVSAEGGVAGLTSVFSLITGELITTCKIALDTTAPDPSQINVYVDEKVIPQGGANGWDYDPASNTITIKGATCDQVKTKGAKVISVSYGCPTIK
jgi:hypothetical protein